MKLDLLEDIAIKDDVILQAGVYGIINSSYFNYETDMIYIDALSYSDRAKSIEQSYFIRTDFTTAKEYYIIYHPALRFIALNRNLSCVSIPHIVDGSYNI